ncbi:MAG: hypothetical protein V3T31_03125, partial [candidate division Zixibacteria bacterium]
FAYHDASASFADINPAAKSATVGDMFHPTSNGLLASNGDAVFAGMDNPFRFIRFELDTVGSGGTVSYSYWDGGSWKSFTPASGHSNLTAALEELLLWQDYQTIPVDWQKRSVNSETCFWIKIEVVSDFTTEPVGSKGDAISNLQRLRVGR